MSGARSAKTASESSLSHVVTKADGTVVDLGVVSYWSKNPLKMARWRVWGQPRSRRRIARFNASQPKE